MQSRPKQVEANPVTSRPQPLATVLPPSGAPPGSSHAPPVPLKKATGPSEPAGFVTAVEALRTALYHLEGEAGTVRPKAQETFNQLGSYEEFITADIIKSFISSIALNGVEKKAQPPSQQALATDLKMKILNWAHAQGRRIQTEIEARNNHRLALELKLTEAQNLHQAMLGQHGVVPQNSATIIRYRTQQLERNKKAMSRLTAGEGALQQLLADLQSDQKQ
jgi:hypothetical protein